MATISELVLRLAADSGELVKEFDKADKKVKGFAAKAGVAFTEFTKFGVKAGTAVGATLSAFTQRAINTQDELGKLAQKVGVPVESLSSLRVAAELSDVSMETLGGTFRVLARTAADAATNVKGDAAQAFKLLDVEVKNADGTLRSQDAILRDLVKSFSGIEDGAAKSALAQEVLGKSAQELIPFLNQGVEGLEQAERAAKAFGLIVSGEASEGANQFNDSLTLLKLAGEGLFNQVATNVVPILNRFTENMIKAAEEGGGMKLAVEGITVALKTFGSGLVLVKNALDAVGNVMGGVTAAVVQAASGEWKQAWDTVKSIPKFALEENREDVVDGWEAIWAETAAKVESKAETTGRKIALPAKNATAEIEKARKKAEAEAREFQNLLDRLLPIEAAQRQFTEDQAKLNAAFKAGTIDASTYGAALHSLNYERLKEEIEKAEKAQKDLNDAFIDIRNAADPALAAYDELIERQFKLQEAVDAGLTSPEQAQLISDKLVRQFDEAQDKLKETENVFGGFITRTKDGIQVFGRSMEQWSESLSGALVDIFEQGKINISGLVNYIIRELLRIQIAKNIIGPLTGSGSGGGSGLLGQLAGAAASFFGGGGTYGIGNPSNPGFVGPVQPRHSGGIVGLTGGPSRFVHPGVFAGAPRFHSGLYPGEMPAILKRGERVSTPEQWAAATSGGGTVVNVNVVEGPGTRATVNRKRRSDGQMDIDIMIEQIKQEVASDIRRGGIVGSSIESTFGANRAAGAVR